MLKPLTDKQLVAKYKIKPTDKILDIGGGSKQHQMLQIHTLVDILPPEKAPYSPSPLKAKNFVQLDIQTQKLPFADKSFDFCTCTHTLEDLPSPFLIIAEMSRVAKRGYIATPSRGVDMVFTPYDITNWLTGGRRVPGFAHHQWFFEHLGQELTITLKNYPLLYSTEFQYTNWTGPQECQFYWEKEIKHTFFNPIDFQPLIENYRTFVEKNTNFLHRGRALFYVDRPLVMIKAFVKLLLRRGKGYTMTRHATKD